MLTAPEALLLGLRSVDCALHSLRSEHNRTKHFAAKLSAHTSVARTGVRALSRNVQIRHEASEGQLLRSACTFHD